MLDRITGYWPNGGDKGLGAIRAEKDVLTKDWFFKSHFFQDPVQPGSLGVEAILQAMQSFMLLEGMDNGNANSRFEPIVLDHTVVWHYRGQVTPDSKLVVVEFEAGERGRDPRGTFVIGQARLWVDGLQIYRVPRIGMRIVGAPASLSVSVGREEQRNVLWQLDLRRTDHSWIMDHRPTYTLPVLPLTYEVEMMAAAAAPLLGDKVLVAVENASAQRWVSFPDHVAKGRLQVLTSGTRAQVVLQQEVRDGSFITSAKADLRFASAHEAVALEPLEVILDARRIDEPYLAGDLFHGAALQLMRGLRRGSNGAEALLDSGASGVHPGLLHPGLLDAALHCLPHNDFSLWCPEVEPGVFAYPVQIENLRLFGRLSAAGIVEVQARFMELRAGRFPCTHLRILENGEILAAFDLVETLLPKGRLGSAPAAARRAFLRDRCSVPGVLVVGHRRARDRTQAACRAGERLAVGDARACLSPAARRRRCA